MLTFTAWVEVPNPGLVSPCLLPSLSHLKAACVDIHTTPHKASLVFGQQSEAMGSKEQGVILYQKMSQVS